MLQRKTWLIQDLFIDKVAAKFNIKKQGGQWPDVPLKENYLEPSTEEPNADRKKEYTQLVGSLGFSSCFTRPDVARAHSILARHNQNPGQSQLAAIYHVWRYLIGTKNLGLET